MEQITKKKKLKEKKSTIKNSDAATFSYQISKGDKESHLLNFKLSEEISKIWIRHQVHWKISHAGIRRRLPGRDFRL